MHLPKGWYAILHINELSHKPKSIERFSKNLVVWSDSKGSTVVMDDRCPHRGASLSSGKIKGDCIACPFHGFEFDQNGVCKNTPESKGAVPKLKAYSYPTKVVADMVWINTSDNDKENYALEFAERVYKQYDAKYSLDMDVWNSNIRHCIENDLDYTHAITVHNKTIGAKYNIPDNLSISSGSEHIILSNDKLKMEYGFTNVSSVKFSKNTNLFIFFAPINESSTKLYVFLYRSFLVGRFVYKPTNIVFSLVNRRILKEDRQVVETQNYSEYDSDFLLYHDRMIKAFRDIWSEKTQK